ncbi:MAG: RHS repeat-associated core domain-containing protein [Psychrosphaera sp.]|nr:RHS repeat-associated core domain-containing protein [Psychrosphaera sp.]
MGTSYNITMGYDGLDRLTTADGKWGAASFTYDTMGNITGKNLGSMAVSYVYDPTTKRLNSASVTGSKSKTYSFTYDKKGAVINTGSVLLPRNQAGQLTGSGGHTYVYDGNGKRLKDTKNGAGSKARYSIYDRSGRMIYQWDQQTETITDYIFLGKEMVTEAQVLLGDGSQNVDNTNVGYTGHQWDKDSGLNYMQARYYDPLLGRFLSNDPLVFKNIHSFNRYAYANNNPYKYTDPLGMCAKSDSALDCVEVDITNPAVADLGDITASSALDSTATSSADVFEVEQGLTEKVGFIQDGEVFSVGNAKTSRSSSSFSAIFTPPADADAIIHSHPNQGSTGMNSTGDATTVFETKKPNYVVHKGRVGVTEVIECTNIFCSYFYLAFLLWSQRSLSKQCW